MGDRSRSLWITPCTLVLGVFPLVLCSRVRIDNTDPVIVYSGAWVQLSAPNNYRGTLATTTAEGATASITVNATSISVYGFLGETTGLSFSQYTLDNGAGPELYHPSAVPVSTPQYHIKFWESGDIKPGEHTLQIMNLGDQFWLDYIEVKPSEGADETNSTSISVSTTTSGSIASASRTFSDKGKGEVLSLATSMTSQRLQSISTSRPQRPSPSSTPPPSRASGGISISSSSTGDQGRDMSSQALPTSPPTLETTTVVVPTTRTTQNTSAASPAAPRLTGSAIAGITVGAAFAGQVIILGALCWLRRRRRRIPKGPADGLGHDTLTTTQGLAVRRVSTEGQLRHRSSASITRVPRSSLVIRERELDGGIRLAGGRPGREADFADWVSDLAVLPPEYKSNYGSEESQLRPDSVGETHP